MTKTTLQALYTKEKGSVMKKFPVKLRPLLIPFLILMFTQLSAQTLSPTEISEISQTTLAPDGTLPATLDEVDLSGWTVALATVTQ